MIKSYNKLWKYNISLERNVRLTFVTRIMSKRLLLKNAGLETMLLVLECRYQHLTSYMCMSFIVLYTLVSSSVRRI
jgi:hypothetical protein